MQYLVKCAQLIFRNSLFANSARATSLLCKFNQSYFSMLSSFYFYWKTIEQVRLHLETTGGVQKWNEVDEVDEVDERFSCTSWDERDYT